MAGIKEALSRVANGNNEGMVADTGVYKSPVKCSCGKKEACKECVAVPYVIIRLDDGGRITQYAENGIHMEEGLERGDPVILMINDNWNATWMNRQHVKYAGTEGEKYGA